MFGEVLAIMVLMFAVVAVARAIIKKDSVRKDVTPVPPTERDERDPG